MPIVAIMEEQVNTLQSKGISTAYAGQNNEIDARYRHVISMLFSGPQRLARIHGVLQTPVFRKRLVGLAWAKYTPLFNASVLKRWKLNWCDVWIDGSLVFYRSESRREYEHRVGLKTACVDVRSGLECGGVTPPDSHPRENLVVVVLRHGSTVHLCANSEDEAIAWKLTLLETRRNPVFTYDPYDDSYQSVPLNSHETIYIRPGPGPGTHHVVIQRDPFDGVAEHLALGLVAGMAAGAAMRSFLWLPFLFC